MQICVVFRYIEQSDAVLHIIIPSVSNLVNVLLILYRYMFGINC